MDADRSNAANSGQVYAIRHWLFQVVPPLLMLCVLFIGNDATSLVFLIGILALPFLLSVVSLLIRLIRIKKGRYYLLRPMLTISIFLLLLYFTRWTYQIALEQIVADGKMIHRQCNEMSVCPDSPAGWRKQGSMLRKHARVLWLGYPAVYYRKKEADFVIHLYQGSDLGHDISGGVGLALSVERHLDR